SASSWLARVRDAHRLRRYGDGAVGSAPGHPLSGGNGSETEERLTRRRRLPIPGSTGRALRRIEEEAADRHQPPGLLARVATSQDTKRVVHRHDTPSASGGPSPHVSRCRAVVPNTS